MNGELIPLALTVLAAALAAWSWRRGRRLTGALVGLFGVGAALVAIRGLPEPMIVGVLLVVLAGVALVTAWPLLARARRAGSRTGDDR